MKSFAFCKKKASQSKILSRLVKSGEIEPYWDDGSPIDFEDFEIALNEIEEAQKGH